MRRRTVNRSFPAGAGQAAQAGTAGPDRSLRPYGGAGTVVDEADRADVGRNQKADRHRILDDLAGHQVVGVHRHGVVEVDQRLGLHHPAHGLGHGGRVVGPLLEQGLPGGQGPGEDHGGPALLGRETDVAARESQAVELAHDRAPDHGDGQRKVLRHLPNHRQLLVVLLAEVSPARSGHGEELGHHRGHAVEVARP